MSERKHKRTILDDPIPIEDPNFFTDLMKDVENLNWSYKNAQYSARYSTRRTAVT